MKAWKAFLSMLMLAGVVIGAGDEGRKAELEARAKEVLAMDNVSMRKEVGVLFELGDLYLKENNIARAMRLYEQGLTADSLNFAYQVKHAKLLLTAGEKGQAVEKLKIVSTYAEEAALIDEARRLLATNGFEVGLPAENEPNQVNGPILYLVPIGEMNATLLRETATELEKIVKVNVVVEEAAEFELGKFDRLNSESYIKNIAERIQESLTPQEFQRQLSLYTIRSIETASYSKLKLFVQSFLKENLPKEEYAKFLKILENAEQEGQYDANRLLGLIQRHYDVSGGTIGYLAITNFDLYGNDSNFLFGSAQDGCGIMSYHRFTGAFNEEPQNRPRLVGRTVKQAVSSTMFIMGIPRCNTPMCVRAYPNSLSEHDAKQSSLCGWCQERLEGKLAVMMK